MVVAYSQLDNRWANKFIGNTKLTFGKFGCFLTSIAMLDGRKPPEINKILTDGKAINKDGLLYPDKAAKLLGMTYSYKKTNDIFPCICETNHFKHLNIPQHFFIMLDKETIIDPLGGLKINNPYNIVSYRLFTKEVPA